MQPRQCSPRTGVTLSPGSSVYARSMPVWREPEGAPRRRRSPVRNASERLYVAWCVGARRGASQAVEAPRACSPSVQA